MDCAFSNFQFDDVINVKFLPKFRLQVIFELYVSFILSLCLPDAILKQSLVATNISNFFRVEHKKSFNLRSDLHIICPIFCQIHLKSDDGSG